MIPTPPSPLCFQSPPTRSTACTLPYLDSSLTQATWKSAGDALRIKFQAMPQVGKMLQSWALAYIFAHCIPGRVCALCVNLRRGSHIHPRTAPYALLPLRILLPVLMSRMIMAAGYLSCLHRLRADMVFSLAAGELRLSGGGASTHDVLRKCASGRHHGEGRASLVIVLFTLLT